MKKYILIGFAVTLCLFITACFTNNENAPVESEPPVGTSQIVPNPLQSQSPSSIPQEKETPSTIISASIMAKVYYDYLTSLEEIETEATTAHGGGSAWWNVYDLYYYLDDINNDGIIDLTISAEISDSNGIEIYTYKNGQVEKLISNHMPYSAGTEIFTLAKYEDIYGIKYLRLNSVGDFSFFRINKDGTIETMIEGWSYDLNGNALDEADNYDKISPITFYRIEELERMI